jgi:hypothetical protein
MLRRAHFAWWAFPKRHRANCGAIAIIRKVPILGRHTRQELTLRMKQVRFSPDKGEPETMSNGASSTHAYRQKEIGYLHNPGIEHRTS